jgi:DNA-directed RNA polymerase II subunit RPB2
MSKLTSRDTEVLYNIYYDHSRTQGKYELLNGNTIRSFNKSLLEDIPNILRSSRHKDITFYVKPTTDMGQSVNEIRTILNFNDIKYNTPMGYDRKGNLMSMTPDLAMKESKTYAIDAIVDVSLAIYVLGTGGKLIATKTFTNKVTFTEIPIIVRSAFCKLANVSLSTYSLINEDPLNMGGYFIVGGNIFCIIMQESHIPNRPYLYESVGAKKIIQCELWCKSEDDYSQDTRIEIAYKSINIKPSTTKKSPNIITLNIKRRFDKNDIPFPIVCRALGIETDFEIANCVLSHIPELRLRIQAESILTTTFEYANSSMIVGEKDGVKLLDLSQSAALIYIFRKTRSIRRIEKSTDKEKIIEMMDIFNTTLFPQVADNKKKFAILGHCVSRLLLCVMGEIPLDDRDAYVNKRINSVGRMYSILFDNAMVELVNQVRKKIETTIVSYDSIEKLFSVNLIDRAIPQQFIGNIMKNALSRGEWSAKRIKSDFTPKGVSQNIAIVNYNALLSVMHRIKVPSMSSTARPTTKTKLHLIDSTQCGYVCPFETPDGAEAGLIKHETMFCENTLGSSLTEIIESDIFQKLVVSIDEIHTMLAFLGKQPILLNGTLYGYTADAETLYEGLIDLRRKGKINRQCSIIRDYDTFNEIRIYSDQSRLVIPLFIVNKDGTLRLTRKHINAMRKGEMKWDDLLEQEIVEWITIEELVHNCQVADYIEDIFDPPTGSNGKLRFTHCRMHPSAIYGYIMNMIPFSPFTQAPRNLYSCQHTKYAHGIPSLFHDKEMNNKVGALFFPQRPLVSSTPARVCNYDKRPTGMNCIVAVASLTGYNQEDSLIVNQSFVDRGGLSILLYILKKSILQSKDEYFKRPDLTMKTFNTKKYDKVDPLTGIPLKNTKIEPGEIVISKVMLRDKTSVTHTKSEFIDASTEFKEATTGIIDDAFITRTESDDRKPVAKVKICMLRKCENGDKLSSRCAQKGVCGMLFSREDLPYTADGIIPDLIINPHATPSRMIISQKLETLCAKTCGLLGTSYNDTAFSNNDRDILESFSNALEQMGFSRDCTEEMYNPFNGEKMRTKIFIGPTFYQRLPQIVKEKKNVRAVGGPVTMLTHQPPQGRSRDGGPRVGEMERDALLSLGVAHFQKECSMEGSDKFNVFVCARCGQFIWTEVYEPKARMNCRYCKIGTEIHRVEIPSATKLLIQIIGSMGMGCCCIPEPMKPMSEVIKE